MWLGLVSACAVVARPEPPRVATSARGTEVRLDHFRRDQIAVATRGPEPVAGAWLVPGHPATPACGAGVAALQLGPENHDVPRAPGETLTEARFKDGMVVGELARPSTLAVQLAGDPAPCLDLVLSDPSPSYRWRISTGDGPINVGRGLHVFVGVPAHGSTTVGPLEWDLVRIGKWLGPVRPSIELGVVIANVFAFRSATMLLGYPLVVGRFALGVAAGYELRPSWSYDFGRGDHFKWLYGPRAELHLARTGPTLLGFPPAHKLETYALVLWAARSTGGGYAANLFGLGFVLN